jgi:DNA-directed RNA polymerase beta subunit
MQTQYCESFVQGGERTLISSKPLKKGKKTTKKIEIKDIDIEIKDIETPKKEIETIIEETSKSVLGHLDNYIEEPGYLLESYFEGKHLERLVRHQIESYNHFVHYQIQRTIQMFNPVIIHSENDYIPERQQYFLEIQIHFENFKIYQPQIHENNGATKTMLPQEARLRNFTYAANMTIDLHIQYIIRDTEDMATPKRFEKVLPKINIGKMPVMLKSAICVLNETNQKIHHKLTGECPLDCGGYFIIKGSEKTVLGQERAAENRIYCFDGKNTAKWNWYAEIKSVPDFKCISPKQIEMMIANKNNGFGQGMYIQVPRFKQPMELFVLFRAMGVLSDKRICEYIILDIKNEKTLEILDFLKASIIDGNKYMTQEDALKHVTSLVAFTAPPNVDKETGLRKKREFAVDVLNNDLFPHCQSLEQKLYLVGYMAKKLIETAKGWRKPDDRDSYVNKRIELTGTLLNNLFRNYFNKLVKEMQKCVVREINGRSSRSMQDYENIINMTNIYKLIKSSTIENGINRALSTGDFSIKQANSSKVGVGQVLNRLTYPATLSHLRRINTPLEKSGELVAPRKLHGTTFGFLCCLTGDTNILLPDGTSTKKIKDLKDGDWVLTIERQTLHGKPSEIHNFFSKMPERLFEMTTLSGKKIKATGDHPFLIKKDEINEMVNLENLQLKKDRVIVWAKGAIFDYVDSIVEIEPELVYDFTTYSENHSFVANSFVVSNCVETPEGQSIGIVKNIAYMSHITIPTNSHPLYDYVLPQIHKIEEVSPDFLSNKVKVFINGSWVGVSTNPLELYADMKEKKYAGIINIYTSIVFDFKNMEIRICSDGGRLTRPLLRVKNNRALITMDIIHKVRDKELLWNDLLTCARLDESVMEYIDVEEQEYAMIAMKQKTDLTMKTEQHNYTHCEIHPSTIFGVLASCIPFPEHNQAPRNTYECLDIEELVWMADGTKKPIKDVIVGDSVLTFHPETFEISKTKVVRHFIIPNQKQRFCIKTEDGQKITATSDHKFMTNFGWKTVLEIIKEFYLFKANPPMLAIYDNNGRFSHLQSKIRIGLFKNNRCTFTEIQDFDIVKNGLVSDIEVESENHSFIAGSGFLSSNCAQLKQAIGVYALNFDQRMDKTAYVMTYPSRPLVDTRLMNYIQIHKAPSGCQIHVAIMSHTGYNQEDSLLINQGSIDRGMFMSTIYHTEKDEDKNIIRDEIIRCNPDKTKTKSIKFGNYDKINNHGFIPENTKVENRDVIISKIIPIKENRNDPTKIIKFEDQSKIHRTTEESYIDKNYTGRNGDGYNFAKTRVRILRKPVIGDKFCSLPTQQVLTDKGWIPIIDLDIQKHRVCTLDSGGNMMYEFPSAKFEYDHNGPMYSVCNKQVEIVCTLNHKLYVQRRYAKQYELIEAQHVMGKMVRFQKSLNNVYHDVEWLELGEKRYKMDDWLPLLGMFISDGSTNGSCVYLSALKERKVNFNTEILNKLGLEFTYNANHGNFGVNKKKYPEIYEHMNKLSVGAFNKYLPDYVWSLSKRQCIILLEALLKGDGHTMQYKGQDQFSRYGTISPRLADDISRLCTHCGHSGTIKIAAEPEDNEVIHITATLGARAGKEYDIVRQHTYYKISIIRSQNQPWINKKHNESNVEELIQYSGKVYCIEMPSSHLYYMRETNFSPTLLVGNSSRHGQKGTCGNIIPECDMPFNKDGIRPDIILNPHAIPSRMTIGQLKETILGKVLIELGFMGDGTPFSSLDVETICEQLQKLGYQSQGNEIMYNGLTGEQMEMSIFFGPVYYQRLKHMVNDKQHSRAFGPMVNLTRQPAEGRSRDGGFRVGEMERDVLLAHGMSRFTKERLYDVSDKYSVYVCKKCGMIASYYNGENKWINKLNDNFTIHHCNTCNNMTEFALVDVPYAYKLFSQELQTINVVPRIITE